MEKIDFSEFNKPKYFPMWLCEGDTLKLAQLGDSQLDELDANIRNIAGQFDIDNASGAELDRIGKILGEERNGCTDRIYRIYLKLRTMLNTADGTVEDIIRFVKFFFSSETVHLVPNYPAGLRILHDGFNDTVDFNRIIKQIVGAGIAYDTRELFNMTEEFPIEESDVKRVHRADEEYFPSNGIFRDGRVLRDGVTVLPTHAVDLYRDGAAKRNAEAVRNGIIRVQADGTIATPVHRNSGISDGLLIGFARHLEDEWESRLFRNGAAVRDGSETRGGKSARSFNDALLFDGISQHDGERLSLSDTDEKKAAARAEDCIGRGYKRNGRLVRNGIHRRAGDRIIDFTSRFSMAACAEEGWTESDDFAFDTVSQADKDNFPVSDESAEGGFSSLISDGIGRGYRRNGTLLRGGASYRSSGGITDPAAVHIEESAVVDGWAVWDSLEAGKRCWFHRGGTYTRGGGITRKSGVLEAI